MWQLQVPPLELVARTVIVYVVFFAALRLFGKREIGQFTLFDVALVLLAANAVQPAVTGPDTSVTGGAIILATIFSLNRGIAELRERSPLLRGLLEFRATVVGRDGRWFGDVLAREGIDVADCEAALREHGLEQASEMKLATLEEDGSISIVPVDQVRGGRRRRRYRRRAL